MKIIVTITKDIEPDCSECEYLKKTPFSDDAYGATKTFYDTECIADSLEECPDVARHLDDLVLPAKWNYDDYSVEE